VTAAGALWAAKNRGIVLDLVVFFVNLILVLALGAVANNVLHATAEDVGAKLAIGFFFTALVAIQPVGPFLKRWSFHQRHAFSAESGAGCLVFWFMPVYLVMMFALCTAAAVVLSQAFPGGERVGVAFQLAGMVWSVVSVSFVYRYFMKPNTPPRWKFLSTPAAERLGDAAIYLNAIGFAVVWNRLTASSWFTEAVTRTPLGAPGSITDILGRLIATAIFAMVLYFPARIYFLAEDRHRSLTWATMLLANLPLIIRVTFAPAGHL
jgi:hypothetical protein